MTAKRKIKKGDTVFVVAGRERGKSGKVTRVAPDHGHVFVERLNMVKRHQKSRGPQGGGGGILEKEAPIPISNVMFLCAKCNEPVRVGRKQLDDGRRVRTCRGCGEQLDA
jgi:large subunit ribosomal protein L24